MILASFLWFQILIEGKIGGINLLKWKNLKYRLSVFLPWNNVSCFVWTQLSLYRLLEIKGISNLFNLKEFGAFFSAKVSSLWVNTMCSQISHQWVKTRTSINLHSGSFIIRGLWLNLQVSWMTPISYFKKRVYRLPENSVSSKMKALWFTTMTWLTKKGSTFENFQFYISGNFFPYV